jgi:hypothetical protein
MGSDAYANIFYGFTMGEEWKPGEWQDTYAASHGINRPSVPYPVKRGRYGEETDKDHPDFKLFSNYWEKKRELAKQSLCDVLWYGSLDGCSQHGIAVADSVVRGSWDSEIDLLGNTKLHKQLYVPYLHKLWDEQLKDFCSRLVVTPKTQPKWWLVAAYG